MAGALSGRPFVQHLCSMNLVLRVSYVGAELNQRNVFAHATKYNGSCGHAVSRNVQSAGRIVAISSRDGRRVLRKGMEC